MLRLIAVLMLLAACSNPENGRDGRYLELPESLEEISGLAVASPDSVFGHDDEAGIVHEISLAEGRIIRSFAIGDPVIEDDFEGIAADGEQLWMINSEGIIRAFNAGSDGTHVGYREYDTGVGEYCEIEGLSLAPRAGILLIVCKDMHQGEKRGTLTIYEWDTRTQEAVGAPWRRIDLTEALGRESSDFAPSGIEWLSDSRQLLVIAARGRSLLVLDENGRITARHRLNPGSHPQSEGVTVVGSNQLVIADEGQRGGPGQIAIYPFPLS